jgi:hypothetical protein
VLEYQIRHSLIAEGLAIHDNKELIPVAPGKIQFNDVLENQVREGIRLVNAEVQEAAKE